MGFEPTNHKGENLEFPGFDRFPNLANKITPFRITLSVNNLIIVFN